MNGIIIHNQTQRTANFAELRDALQSAFEALGANVAIMPNTALIPGIIDGKARVNVPGKIDFALFYDKDVRLAFTLEKSGIRVYNSATAISICDDKIATMTALSGLGIPMPDTLFAPFTYDDSAVSDARQVVALLGLPVVVKHAYGSFGEQVYIARTLEEVEGYAKALALTPHLYQKYVKESFGRDYRIQIVGGQFAACMARYNDGDFRANITAGGRYGAFDPPAEAVAMAIKVCDALRLDFAGVDFLFGKDGPVLCEVNSNAFFVKLSKVSGVDVAARIAAHVVGDVGALPQTPRLFCEKVD